VNTHRTSSFTGRRASPPPDTAPASGRRVDRRRAAARRGLHRRIYRVRVASTGCPATSASASPSAVNEPSPARLAARATRHAPAARRDDTLVRTLVGIDREPGGDGLAADQRPDPQLHRCRSTSPEGRHRPKHLKVLRPAAPFRIVTRGGGTFVGPRSYDSLRDDRGRGRIGESGRGREGIATLKPRIEDAQRDLGAADFDRTLERAICRLLAEHAGDRRIGTPQAEGNRLWATPMNAFESLMPAQKQLLRMGPRNVRIVKAKLAGNRPGARHPAVASAGVVARQRRRRRQQIHTEQQRNRGERRVRAAGPATRAADERSDANANPKNRPFVFAPLLSSARRLAPPAAGRTIRPARLRFSFLCVFPFPPYPACHASASSQASPHKLGA